MKYFTSDLHLDCPYLAYSRGFVRKDLDFESIGLTDPRDGHLIVDEDDLKVSFSAQDIVYNDSINLSDVADIELHDKTILNAIKSVMYEGEDNELYILGDLSDDADEAFLKTLEQIRSLGIDRSRMHLILGNHDPFDGTPESSFDALSKLFCEIGRVGVTILSSERGPVCPVFLSHFPWADDMDDHEPVSEGIFHSAFDSNPDVIAVPHFKDGLLLYGHTHQKTPVIKGCVDHVSDAVNVGWDAWKRPVSECELVRIFKSMW